MWDNIIASMTELTAIYRVILELSRKKKQALVAASVEELGSLVKEEESLVLRIGAHEQARRQLILDLAAAYKIAPEAITPAKTKELSDAATAARLQAAEDELASVLRELAPLNKLNSELIQQSLNYVNYNLNLLTQTVADTNYAAKGADKPVGRAKTLIDTKV